MKKENVLHWLKVVNISSNAFFFLNQSNLFFAFLGCEKYSFSTCVYGAIWVLKKLMLNNFDDKVMYQVLAH